MGLDSLHLFNHLKKYTGRIKLFLYIGVHFVGRVVYYASVSLRPEALCSRVVRPSVRSSVRLSVCLSVRLSGCLSDRITFFSNRRVRQEEG